MFREEAAVETGRLGFVLDRVATEYDEFADSEEARAALTAELPLDELFGEAFTDAPEAGSGKLSSARRVPALGRVASRATHRPGRCRR